MKAVRKLGRALDALLARIDRAALSALVFQPIAPKGRVLGSHLAQVAAGSGPGLLPIASNSDETLCLHVRPGTPWDRSAAVLVDGERRNFVCQRLGELPTAALLFMWTYSPDETSMHAANCMCEGVPDRSPPPPALIRALQTTDPRLMKRLFPDSDENTPDQL